MGSKGQQKARTRGSGHVWVRASRRAAACSYLSTEIHAHARTHKHACMHVLAGGPHPEEHTLMLRFQSWPQTKAAFFLRVKWHDYLSSELLSIVGVYQPGGTRGRMNGRPLNTWASFHFIMTR